MRLNDLEYWLGIRRSPIAVGVHITSERITVAAVRSTPLRLAALGRTSTPQASVVNDEIRAVEPLAKTLSSLFDRLRIARRDPVVVSIKPLAEKQPTGYPVRRWSLDQIHALTERMELDHATVDPLPAATDRLAAVVDPSTIGTAPHLAGSFAPPALAPHLDLGRDGPAIGAAMAGLGISPLLEVIGVETPGRERWIAQTIDYSAAR